MSSNTHNQSTTQEETGVTSSRIYLQLITYLTGFLLFIAINIGFTQLFERLNAQIENEHARLQIGETIIADLTRIENKVYKMATSTSIRGQQKARAEIQTAIQQLDQALNVLEHGGSLQRTTQLNIESQATMLRQIRYRRSQNASEYILEVIDLRPKLIQIESESNTLLNLLMKREQLRDSSQQNDFIQILSDIKDHLRKLPPLFTRMSENANRLFYESQLKLDALEANIQSRKSRYNLIQTTLSASIILIVLLISHLVLRQVTSSNNQLNLLTRELEFQKFAVDQHAIVSSTDAEGRITYANDKFCSISGYSREELLNNTHSLLKSGKQSAAFYTDLWHTIASGQTWHGEICNHDKHHHEYWMDSTIVPLLDSEQKPFQYISISTDVTEHKAMEERIRESNHFLSRLTDTMGEGVYAEDKQGQCIFVNQEAERLLGWKKDELLGKKLYQLIHVHNEDQHPFNTNQANIQQSIAQGTKFSSDTEIFVHKDGHTFPVSIVAAPLYENSSISGTVAVFQDISSRKEAESAMSAAKEAAESASKLKSDFLANMSHEIRTPMNAIIGMSHLVLQTSLNHKQHHQIEKVHQSAESLLRIINDILDFSKIEADKLELEATEFRLDDVFDNLANLLSFKAEEKGLELLFNIASSTPVKLIGDPLRLGQILINLCSNAVKFTEQGEVIIEVEPTNIIDNKITMQFTVSDTGIGMSASQCQSLFQSFNQLDSSTTRKYGGTGLGLAISRKLAEMMEGKIWLTSTENVGSTFYFQAQFGLAAATEITLPSPSEQFPHLRTLVIDKNRSARNIYQSMLNSLGLQTSTISSGEEAIELITTNQDKTSYDLIILAWHMPDLDGLSLLKRLRSLKLKTPPRVMILASPSDHDAILETTENLAIDGIINKPVTPYSLMKSLTSTLHSTSKEKISNSRVHDETSDCILQLQGARILLVEDNEINQEVASSLLEINGLSVIIANNGVEALNQLEQASFDGVLMDIQMPEMDGYEASRRIRQQKAFKDLPIIAMTANAMPSDVGQALSAGMNDHIAKPISTYTLFTTLAHWITPSQQPSKPLNDSAPSTSSNIDTLTVLNTAQAIKRLDNNHALYQKMLTKFSSNQSVVMTDMQEAINQQDQAGAIRGAHTLKTISATIGANKLERIARELEYSFKTKLSEHEPQLEALHTALKITLDAVNHQLALSKPNQPQQSYLQNKQVRLHLDTLKQKLEAYDAESMDDLKAAISANKDQNYHLQFKKLEHLIDRYDYELALSMLNQLLETMDTI